ncbi:MAG: hypothetical protein EON59_10640 [Alphaproteobacteria bacterium]|nr:MAG: hypothetical protein EON59_10640 [Alphaproteobacteria bacterium]
MPRYFFNVGGDAAPDSVGHELRDLATARSEAVKLAASLIRDLAHEFWDQRDFSMTVSDDRGVILFALEFMGHDGPSNLGCRR